MSEIPYIKIKTHLIEALGLAAQHGAPDRVRSSIVNALLVCQMHDEGARAMIEKLLLAGELLGERPSTLADSERLRLVPKIGSTRDEQPRAHEMWARCITCGAQEGVDSDEERIAWLRAHEREHGVEVWPQAPVCAHIWHAMIADGVDPFDRECPAACGATVQNSRVATPVNVLCARCGQPLHDANCPDECDCQPQDVPAAVHQNPHYGVRRCEECQHTYSQHNDLAGCAVIGCNCSGSRAQWRETPA